MSDVEDKSGGKEENKPPSPKPDQDEVAPPLIQKEETGKGQKKKVTTAPPPKATPKKSVVLSGEAMKEVQKQAKATKEERRLQMDARHQFLFSKLADALGLDTSQVEDAVLGDERFDMIEKFFEANGARKLMFFYQDMVKESQYRHDGSSIATHVNVNVSHTSVPQKKLFITTGDAEGLTGIGFFFLRPSVEKKVTVQNINEQVSFMWMDCNGGRLLEGFENMMAKIMVPALKSQESWGSELDSNNGRVADFLEQLEKFVVSLGGARDNMRGHITLSDTEYGYMLDDMTTLADYQSAANNSDILEHLEELLATWSKQIEQVLAESEQIRREADDIGPAAELSYWKSRMAKFNTLLEQIKTPRCKAVVGILNQAKSKSIRKWRELDSRITDAANEAKDNVKYLYTLDKFFGPLVKCNPETLCELIPSLMNSIRMIYSISSYYNTSERMTSLFVKVTNQMITTCKNYIKHGVTKIWEHERHELMQRIEHCIELNKEYQKQFQKTKAKLKESPAENQFEFSENYIFGKFDTFCKRLDKLLFMINTMDAYAGIGDVKIEGIEAIAVRYKTLIEATKKKNYDVLDHRRGEFDVDFMEFRSQFDALQAQIQAFVDTWFEKSLSTEQAIELLNRVEGISGPKLELRDKYLRILQNYGRDLEAVRKLYQKQKSDPTVPRNLPPIAGKISWARQLYRRIEGPMKTKKKKVPTATLR